MVSYFVCTLYEDIVSVKRTNSARTECEERKTEMMREEKQNEWRETENGKPKMSPKVYLLLFCVHIGVCGSLCKTKKSNKNLYILILYEGEKKAKRTELLESICYTLHNLLCGLLQTKRYSLHTAECSFNWIHTNTAMCNLRSTYDGTYTRQREREREPRDTIQHQIIAIINRWSSCMKVRP